MRNTITVDPSYADLNLSEIDKALPFSGLTLHIDNVCVAKTKGRWGIETHIDMPNHYFILHASIDDSTLIYQIDKGTIEQKFAAFTELVIKCVKYDRLTLERYARNYQKQTS